MLNKINILSTNLGLGRCLQQKDIFDEQSYLDSTLANPLDDCTLFKGNNLNYLLKMASSQCSTVNLCYIDPPYNTGSSFLYHDTRKGDAHGVFGKHSHWMKFMLPRLVAAREMLCDDGVIAISIDDYEHTYLKVLLDHIFGDENFIGNIVVCRSKNGKGSKKNIAPNHEYLMVYGKSKSASLRGVLEDKEKYNKNDEHGLYKIDGLFRKKGEASLRTDRPNMHYPLYYDKDGLVFVDKALGLKMVTPADSKGIERRWLWSKETARNNSWKLYASPSGIIYVKNYFSKNKRTKIRTLWNNTDYYTERATKEIKEIYGEKIFDTPKPLNFIKDILDQMGKEDSLILDFFSGSGTTAQAAYELNKSDNGTRKVLLMESLDAIPENHIAQQHGFLQIADITKYRLEYIKGLDEKYNYHVISPTQNNLRQII